MRLRPASIGGCRLGSVGRSKESTHRKKPKITSAGRDCVRCFSVTCSDVCAGRRVRSRCARMAGCTGWPAGGFSMPGLALVGRGERVGVSVMQYRARLAGRRPAAGQTDRWPAAGAHVAANIGDDDIERAEPISRCGWRRHPDPLRFVQVVPVGRSRAGRRYRAPVPVDNDTLLVPGRIYQPRLGPGRPVRLP